MNPEPVPDPEMWLRFLEVVAMRVLLLRRCMVLSIYGHITLVQAPGEA